MSFLLPLLRFTVVRYSLFACNLDFALLIFSGSSLVIVSFGVVVFGFDFAWLVNGIDRFVVSLLFVLLVDWLYLVFILEFACFMFLLGNLFVCW